MRPSLSSYLPLACLLVAVSTSAWAAERSGLDALQGRWVGKYTDSEGRATTRVIEIKQDKLLFQMLGADEQVRFVAKGNLRAEKLGPFSALRITELQAGRSADDTQAVDDELNVIYAQREDTLTLASNFDKERERQKPEAVTYVRTAAPAGDSRLEGKWKMELSMADSTREYELNLSKTDGKLQATVVSSRSGEHKAKSVTYQEEKLVFEVEREIQGNNVTLVYTGKLSGDELSGTVVVKGAEDQFSGKWKAKK
jgi:hypothetical protein